MHKSSNTFFKIFILHNQGTYYFPWNKMEGNFFNRWGWACSYMNKPKHPMTKHDIASKHLRIDNNIQITPLNRDDENYSTTIIQQCGTLFQTMLHYYETIYYPFFSCLENTVKSKMSSTKLSKWTPVLFSLLIFRYVVISGSKSFVRTWM